MSTNVLDLLGTFNESCIGKTKKGNRCKNSRTSLYSLTCKVHRTKETELLESLCSRIDKESSDRTTKTMQSYKDSELRNLRDKVTHLELRLKDTKRLRTHTGKQIFQCGNHAYVWAGEGELEVGDKVMVPPNWLFNYSTEREVTELGTFYEGLLTDVHKKVEHVLQSNH